MCIIWCYFTTNSRAVCDTYRNSSMDWSERITLRWFRTLQAISSYVLPWIERDHLHHPLGLRVCTSCYVFNLSLSLSLPHVLEMSRSWCIAGFVNIVRSYGVFPSLSSCDELSFTFEVSLLSNWILLWIWEHLMYVLHGIPMVTMGCSIDSLDVCFGTQLTDSRGDIGVIYA